MSLIENETCTKCQTQCLDCRDARITKEWQPEDMILIPLNLARRFENDEADASDRQMLKGFIRDA